MKSSLQICVAISSFYSTAGYSREDEVVRGEERELEKMEEEKEGDREEKKKGVRIKGEREKRE